MTTAQKVRVLVGSIPMPMNRFLVDLNASLARQCSLTHDPDVFWEMDGHYDVVHLHFPEYLTLAIQASYKNGLSDQLIAETEERLRYWSDRSAIVVTRHVLLPHDALRDPQWEKMYEVFYRYAHGVVHFASASVEEFRERYRRSEFRHGTPRHAIIPHHNYSSLPNTISRQDARKQLGIGAGRKVVLVFGSIRNAEETGLILSTFQGLKCPGKLLLVSNWRESLAKVSWIRLKYWLRDLKRLYYRMHPSYHMHYGFVAEPDTQVYLNAADVLFIPRLKVLNSGNVTLGMTFGKVVVGPDSWDVGQLLRERGHPVFDPEHPQTSSAAVERAFQLVDEGIVGPAGRKLALDQWSPDQCGQRYLEFFHELRQARRSGVPNS